MKKLLLSFIFIASSVTLSAQIILSGVSPASVQTNYEFSWADPQGGDWSTPDFNIPGTYVQAELMIVDDGSTGTNPQGNPISAEGCNPLINDLTGKIAVIYRNTCEFGTKSLNAQNAGAVGVIIINREEEVIQMGGGVDGLSVTIPVGFIKASDGLTLTTAMGNGPVEVFFGNRAGIYGDDLSISSSAAMIPKAKVMPSLLAQDSTEYSFELGLTIGNLGFNDADSVMVEAMVMDPMGDTIYNESAGKFSMTGVSGTNIDSVDVLSGMPFTLPDFQPMMWMEGKYTLVYRVSNDTITDEFPDDNMLEIDFFIKDDLFAYSRVNEDTLPWGSDFYQPAGGFTLYSACIAFQNDNAARLALEGVSFSASNTDFSLQDEVFNVYAYRWLDEFVDLNDPNVGFNGLAQAAFTTYQYTEDAQREPVYAELEEPLYLNDGERYLVCVQTSNTSVFIGFDTRNPYIYNQGTYLQPIQVTETDANYFAVGFGADIIPAIGLHVRDTAMVEIPIDTTDTGVFVPEHMAGGVQMFPNPTNGNLIVEASEGFEYDMDVQVTDMTGRVVYQEPNAIKAGDVRLTIDLNNLTNGVYIVSLKHDGNSYMVKQVLKN
ncbi:MAG: PA domain-containing protein [Salibacteraceae bacterium]